LIRGRKLLLADDSITIQKVIELTFGDEGLDVATVGDGQQAIEMLDSSAPDIVLADIFMPGKSGYEVCEYIKRTERLQHIPVVLLVGSFEPFDEAEARRVGADDYLTKPFQSIRQLVSKVRGLLGGESRSGEATTQRLLPLDEPVPEKRPGTDFLERTTADTAPLSPHHQDEPLRAEAGDAAGAAASRQAPFADLSMDDEMIQATPAGNYGQQEKSSQMEETPEILGADFEETDILEVKDDSRAPQPAEDSQPVRQEAASVFAPAEIGEGAALSAQAHSARHFSGGGDDGLLELGELEASPARDEADDFILDLEEPLPPRAEMPESIFTETAAPASTEMDSSTLLEFEGELTQSAPQAEDYVAAQVAGEERRAEFAPLEETAAQDAEQAFAQGVDFHPDRTQTPTEPLPGTGQAASADAFSASAQASDNDEAAGAQPFAGPITLEQLSPEVIDAIARRAVEQLSAKVIEQIAWEVVPQLADLLIKRRLEEERKM
jgi:CheY-like chemotaxis protein